MAPAEVVPAEARVREAHSRLGVVVPAPSKRSLLMACRPTKSWPLSARIEPKEARKCRDNGARDIGYAMDERHGPFRMDASLRVG